MSLSDIRSRMARLEGITARQRYLLDNLRDEVPYLQSLAATTQPWMPNNLTGAQSAFTFKNSNAGAVPAYGIIRLTGHDGTNFTADQPNDYGSQWLHAVNQGGSVSSGATGTANFGYGQPILCKYNTANTPAFGETWGPVASSWELTKLSGGFAVVGNPSGGNVWVVQSPMLLALGQIDGTGMTSDGSTATMSVFYWNTGTWTDTTYNLTVRVSSAAPIEGGRKVVAIWDGVSKQWVARPLEPHGNHLGQFDANCAAGAAGTFSVYYWNSGTWTDTTNNVTARNGTGTTINTGKKAAISWDGRSAQWIAGPLECN